MPKGGGVVFTVTPTEVLTGMGTVYDGVGVALGDFGVCTFTLP